MRILLPLRDGRVARLWSALALSAVGDQLYNVAMGWVAIGVFGAAAGYLSAARAAIILLAAFFGGSLMDRWGRQASMVGADLSRAAALVLLVAAWYTLGAPSGAALAFAVLVLAIGDTVFNPALQTVLPQLAPRDILPATNGLFDATARVARLLGPGLIAVLGASLAPIHFFTLDALSFLASAAAVAGLRLPRDAAIKHLPRDAAKTNLPRPAAAVPKAVWWPGVVAGFRETRRHRPLAFALDTSGLINGAWFTLFYLALPLLLVSRDDGIARYGMVMASYGVSNLVANLIVGSRPMSPRPGRQILCGIALLAAGMLAIAAIAGLDLAPTSQGLALAAASCLAGFGGPLEDIPVATLRQMLIPAETIAGATRAAQIVTNLGTLVALLLAPLACVVLGTVAVMWICGAVFAGVVAYGLATRIAQA